MFSGIAAGFATAFLQSTSYVCSKQFVIRNGNPLLLTVYSHLVMGIVALLSLPLLLPFVSIPWNWHFGGLIAGWIFLFAGGQTAFFKSLEYIEASRLSSLFGLKILVLAAFALGFQGGGFHWMQYAAIVLSALSAVGMNFSGMALSRKGAGYLGLTLVLYSLCDIVETEMINSVPGPESLILKALAVAGLSYGMLGVVTAFCMGAFPRRRKLMVDAVPFSLTWYFAMVLLYVSFGAIGVVGGNIIQATRGVISVILGAVLVRLGRTDLENPVSRKVWIRRAVMSILMLIALTLYSWGATLNH